MVVSIVVLVGIIGSTACFSCDIVGLVFCFVLVRTVAFGPCCIVFRV